MMGPDGLNFGGPACASCWELRCTAKALQPVAGDPALPTCSPSSPIPSSHPMRRSPPGSVVLPPLRKPRGSTEDGPLGSAAAAFLPNLSRYEATRRASGGGGGPGGVDLSALESSEWEFECMAAATSTGSVQRVAPSSSAALTGLGAKTRRGAASACYQWPGAGEAEYIGRCRAPRSSLVTPSESRRGCRAVCGWCQCSSRTARHCQWQRQPSELSQGCLCPLATGRLQPPVRCRVAGGSTSRPPCGPSG